MKLANSPVHCFPHLFALLLIYHQFQHVFAVNVFRFNSGGYKLNDFDSDPVALVSGEKSTYQLSEPISSLTIGNSHRWGANEGFTYNFPTGHGTFDVDLIFAEIYPPAQSVGRRRFDIFIEDDVAFTNLDVFESVGPNVEFTRSITNAVVSDGALSLSFRKGSQENPMVSAIVIRASNGSDFVLGEFSTTEGVSDRDPTKDPDNGRDFDHQSHAIAGGPYHGTDYNGNSEALVALDGSLSHSHFYDPIEDVSGMIVKYEWAVDGQIVSSDQKFSHVFPVGKTRVDLTVTDQTGDSATAKTHVAVLPATSSGSYCYYYEGLTQLPADMNDLPRPDEGHSTNVINFRSDEFSYSRKNNDDGSPNSWGVRCVTDFTSTNTSQYKFSIKYRGTGVVLFVNNGEKASGGDSGGVVSVVNATVTVGVESVPVELWFFSGSGKPRLQLLVNDVVASPSILSYKFAGIIPTISSLSSTEFQPDGKVQMQISGTGFFNGVNVTIGNVQVNRRLVSSKLLQIPSVPSVTELGGSGVVSDGENITAEVVVLNEAGASNVKRVTYSENAKKGIAWNRVFFATEDTGEKYLMKQPTTVKMGPDGKYYIGSLGGFISRLDVGKDLRVMSKCDSKSLGTFRAVLGMAFNYASRDIRLYVSTNTLYWNGTYITVDPIKGWANGAVEALVDKSLGSCDECMCREGNVVTGLPVSAHDHGVNALMFLGEDLLIAVGGATNAGIPSGNLGGMIETPLSGAILIARLSKEGFDGAIKYDQYEQPGRARQISGDVEVYASGLRNCYDMTMRTNGEIWATENGPNVDYGAVSTDCDRTEEFDGGQEDEINVIREGMYYGHPNRNRKECVFGGGQGPILRLTSASTGIMEYMGNAFGGQLQGQMVVSKYAASGTGKTWRLQGGSGGVRATPMSEYSGLSVEMGLYGELVMPQVQNNFVAVLRPTGGGDGELAVMAVSPRWGRGGQRVFVGGSGFGEGAVVTLGGAECTGVRVVDGSGLWCSAPGGSGVVDVVVRMGARTSVGEGGLGGVGKFIYL